MRTIFILGILLGIAFLAGWFTVDRDTELTTIQINKSEIRVDAEKAIERGREYLERREQSQPHTPTPTNLESPWGPAPAWEPQGGGE